MEREVTVKDLEELVSTIRSLWVGEIDRRATTVRVGTLRTKEQNGCTELKILLRFSLEVLHATSSKPELAPANLLEESFKNKLSSDPRYTLEMASIYAKERIENECSMETERTTVVWGIVNRFIEDWLNQDESNKRILRQHMSEAALVFFSLPIT